MRSFTISLVIALVGAVGCSSSKDTSAGAAGGDTAAAVVVASGTRLHAKLVTGGGAREVVGFHDTKRNEDCTFQPAEDGRMRCLPTSVVSPPTIAFADAACTVPLVQVPVPQPPASCSDAPKYVLVQDSVGCSNTPKELRALVPSSGPTYFTGAGGCTIQQPATPSSPPLFALGDPISMLEFVEAKVTPVAVPGSAVSETQLIGIDGSRQHYGFHDDVRDVDCNFEIMADIVTRCLPKGQRGAALYGDAACASATAVRFNTGCQQTDERFWLDAVEPGKCRSVRAVYPVGVAYQGDTTNAFYTQYTSSSGPGTTTTECSSIGLGGSGNDLRTISADITPLLPTKAPIGARSGRLVPALVADASNLPLVPRWHDTERDVDCAFALASDGKLRCLPASTSATLFSTDGKCTSPGHVAVLTEVPCTGFSGFALIASSTCPSSTRVFALTGQPHDVANASAETAPGRCVSFPSVQKAYDATEVDPTQFVEGALGPE